MSAVKKNAQPLLSIRQLALGFESDSGLCPILYGLDLDIDRGQSVGVLGESGCGKSVTWMAVLGLLGKRAKVQGSVRLDGVEIMNAPDKTLSAIRGRRIAMIFQDPSSSLNPSHRIGAQIGEALALHRGLSGEENVREAQRLLEQVHIPNVKQRMSAYPHEMSGGMNQRIMIAMALAGQPDLLIADEPTTALDATVQAQILDLLGEVRRDTDMALVTISHDLGVIAQTSERAVVMYAGRIVEMAETSSLFSNPRHPYTQGLLAALPDIEGTTHRLQTIAGTVPEAGNLPPGCSFHPRCPVALEACKMEFPVLHDLKNHHYSACLLSIEARQ